MNYEDGIVVGLEANIKLVASKHDIVGMVDNLENYETFKLGDCLHFYAKVSQVGSCRRKVLEAEKCEQIVEWEKETNKDSVHIISNITGISMKTAPNSNRKIRCFKTNFLQEVYETQGTSVDPSLCDFELARMKVIAIRREDDKKCSYWSVLKVITVSIDNNTNVIGQFGRDLETRNSYSGIILADNSNRGDYFIWVPQRDGLIPCPENIRRNYSSNTIQGKWFSFTVNEKNQIDLYSQFRLVDDVLPTRYISNRFEVKVSIFGTDDGYRRDRRLTLESGECGIVLDDLNVLERYRRFSPFTDEAWIFCDWPEFILSPHQDWRSRDSSYESIQFNSTELFRGNERRMRESPRNQFRTMNDSSTTISSRDSENCNFHRNSRNSMFERQQAQSSSQTDHRNQFGAMNDSSTTSSRDSESFNPYRRSGSSMFERQPAQLSSHTGHRSQFGAINDRSTTISSRDRENCNFYRDSRSSMFERQQQQQSPSHTDHRPGSSRNTPTVSFRRNERDPSVASTSESVEERNQEKLREVRFKLEGLQKRIHYLEENDMEISKKLLEDFEKMKIKETLLLPKPKSQKNKDLETIEKLEEKLSNHRKFFIKIREMLECPKVRFEMEQFDRKTMKEIDQLIFEL